MVRCHKEPEINAVPVSKETLPRSGGSNQDRADLPPLPFSLEKQKTRGTSSLRNMDLINLSWTQFSFEAPRIGLRMNSHFPGKGNVDEAA